MEIVLGALAVVLAVGLASALVRAREAERAVHAVAGRLRAMPSPAGLRSGLDQLEARIAAAETAADDLRRDLEYLADLTPVGAIRLDDASRVAFANAAAHTILDHPPGRLAGRTVMEAFVDARVDALVAEARSSGTASAELDLGSPTERTVALRVRRSPVEGLWIILEDVTELRRLQRIRAEFVDNLSHELRTPLTTVSLLAETLAREAASADVPARMRERIAKIEVETGHLVQMVSELLELSRIESGGSLVLADDVDLARLAEASAERLRLFAERQGVTLRVEAAPDLPRLSADPDRLGQVFVNLVHNAVKFSPDGGDVTVRVGRDGDEVVASVEDHGIGIPRADRARVFERFYKVDRARVRGETAGTGLGLSIARHIVVQHGGRIWVESDEGAGSTFTFTIPLPAGAEG